MVALVTPLTTGNLPQQMNENEDDRISGAMPVADAHDDRDTIAPPPPAAPRADRNDFTHWALEELLAKHRRLDDFRRQTSADLALVANEVRGLRGSVESLAPRMSAMESDSRNIRAELALLRSEFEARIAELALLRSEFEARIAELERASR